MASQVAPEPRTAPARAAVGILALLILGATSARLAHDYVSNPSLPRPHDFLQVWSAGRLTLERQNPYDGEQMYALQATNRMPDCRTPEHPDGYASMMWVPPWGLALAMPLGALPVDLAQLAWGYGQLVLIVLGAVVLWRAYGGAMNRAWIAAALALGSGPVWWQTVGGQYAGVLFLGVVGFVVAHRANRPVAAGAFVALTALKPHLFTLLAIGLLIDALRTPFGRRVVLGGLIVLCSAALAATVANPHVWGQYAAAAGGEGTRYYPGLAEWFNPTVQAWVRHALPGRPFWVQFVPLALGAPAFAVYWWRHGNPHRWPGALCWVIPVCLLIAPYGSWPSDQILFLIPVIHLAVRIEARGAGWAAFRGVAVVFAGANLAVVLLTAASAALYTYVWLAPVLAGCLLYAERVLRTSAGPIHPHPEPIT
jgi:hypothetical protein